MNKSMDGPEVNNDSDVSAPKRSVLKAAWVAPFIVAITLPRSGYAANISSSQLRGKSEHGQHHHHDHLQKHDK